METRLSNKSPQELLLLKKAQTLINKSTMHTVDDSGNTADWVMSVLDEEGYPAASMITASRADGLEWIAFCTGLGWNKSNRIQKNPRTCIYLFDPPSFSGISLVGQTEICTDPETKKQMWYDALGASFNGPTDKSWCVLLFHPERYNIFMDGQTIQGTLE